MQHRVRDLLMRQRTRLINALRAHMAELGIVAAQGREGIKELLTIVASEEDVRLPVNAHASLVVLAAGIQAVQTMIGSIEKRIIVQHRSNEMSKRLETIPGIGVFGAWIRRPSDRVVIWRPGSDLCRAKIRPVANRSSGRSRNRATNI
jgi:transposase